MARVKITEYRGKRILLGDSYAGVHVRTGKEKLPAGKLVVKVDQGVKKRMKRGLVKIGVSAAEAKSCMAQWRAQGFTRFIVEPVFPHAPEIEQYFSLERVRDGVRLLHAREGGIEIESHPEKVFTTVIASDADIAHAAQETGLPETFLRETVRVFDQHFLAFMELNPLVVTDGRCVPLDAAVLVDSAGAVFTRAWSEDDVIREAVKHESEDRVNELASTTPASLKLSVINPEGALFLLLSGGGGSIVIADEAQLKGVGHELGNYGEYSGGPTREETYLYAKEVIALMLGSAKPKKALVIAGGVANFTDVQKTFAGIIDALREQAAQLRAQQVKVFVRRGGPNEAVGLSMMRAFLEKEGLLGSVHGSAAVITAAIDDAIEYITTV